MKGPLALAMLLAASSSLVAAAPQPVGAGTGTTPASWWPTPGQSTGDDNSTSSDNSTLLLDPNDPSDTEPSNSTTTLPTGNSTSTLTGSNSTSTLSGSNSTSTLSGSDNSTAPFSNGTSTATSSSASATSTSGDHSVFNVPEIGPDGMPAVTPCQKGSGDQHGCGKCLDDQSIAPQPIANATLQDFDSTWFPNEMGGGGAVWWSVPAPKDGCKILFYNEPPQGYAAAWGTPGILVAVANNDGCYFQNVGSKVSVASCCSNDECVALGAGMLSDSNQLSQIQASSVKAVDKSSSKDVANDVKPVNNVTDTFSTGSGSSSGSDVAQPSDLPSGASTATGTATQATGTATQASTAATSSSTAASKRDAPPAQGSVANPPGGFQLYHDQKTFSATKNYIAPVVPNYWCEPAKQVPNTQMYQRLAFQQPIDKSKNCPGSPCLSTVEGSISGATGIDISTSSQNTTEDGTNRSIQFGYSSGPTMLATFGSDHSESKALTNSTGTSETTTKSTSYSTSIGGIPGTWSQLAFVPIMDCTPMTAVCHNGTETKTVTMDACKDTANSTSNPDVPGGLFFLVNFGT